MVRRFVRCRELRSYCITRNSGEFRVDLRCLFLLQIPRGLLIRRSSHCRLTERHRRNLCFRVSTDQRITNGMETSRRIFKTDIFSRIDSEQLNGHIRRCQCCRANHRLRHVFFVPSYLQGPHKWLKNRHRDSTNSCQLPCDWYFIDGT